MLIHERITYEIIGAAMETHNALGPGWDEWDYHRDILPRLAARGLEFQSKLRSRLVHRCTVADSFELDLLVEDAVVVELKHLRGNFPMSTYTQTISYLKHWDKSLGLMVNFGMERLLHKRIPFTPNSGSVKKIGPWTESNTATLESSVVACKAVLDTYGPGYAARTYRNLVGIECRHRNIPTAEAVAELSLSDGSTQERSATDIFLANGLPILITALNDTTTASDLARLNSFLKQANVPTGLLANYSSKDLHLRPVG